MPGAGRSMKILYDHQIFSAQKFGGISRYFYELMTHSQGLFDYEVSGVFSENEYIKPLQVYREFSAKCSFKGKQRVINYLNKLDSIQEIKKGHYDILHSTYYDPYLLRKKTKPVVITVHDMIHELFPCCYQNDKKTVKNKKMYISNADSIIAISNNTQKDILKLYPETDHKKITVVYHGISCNTNNNINKENYVLYTGQRGGYKNFDVFICAVAPLLVKYDLRLICTGQQFTKYESGLLEKEKINSRTSCIFVSDIDLLELYARALVFVFPSLYEGFGFPILEAFAAGCPVVLSNASCFPEIAGDAALYFDPYSIVDMRAVIEKTIVSWDLQNTLIQKGKELVKKYSWKACAEETAKVYRGIEDSR
jgi:glycosyltransferase involved in cell wall biosynthesis